MKISLLLTCSIFLFASCGRSDFELHFGNPDIVPQQQFNEITLDYYSNSYSNLEYCIYDGGDTLASGKTTLGGRATIPLDPGRYKVVAKITSYSGDPLAEEKVFVDIPWPPFSPLNVSNTSTRLLRPFLGSSGYGSYEVLRTENTPHFLVGTLSTYSPGARVDKGCRVYYFGYSWLSAVNGFRAAGTRDSLILFAAAASPESLQYYPQYRAVSVSSSAQSDTIEFSYCVFAGFNAAVATEYAAGIRFSHCVFLDNRAAFAFSGASRDSCPYVRFDSCDFYVGPGQIVSQRAGFFRHCYVGVGSVENHAPSMDLGWPVDTIGDGNLSTSSAISPSCFQYVDGIAGPASQPNVPIEINEVEYEGKWRFISVEALSPP